MAALDELGGNKQPLFRGIPELQVEIVELSLTRPDERVILDFGAKLVSSLSRQDSCSRVDYRSTVAEYVADHLAGLTCN